MKHDRSLVALIIFAATSVFSIHALAQRWTPVNTYDLPSATVTRVLAANFQGRASEDIAFIDKRGLEVLYGDGHGGVEAPAINVVPAAADAVIAPFTGGKYDDIVALVPNRDGGAAKLQLIQNLGHKSFAEPEEITGPSSLSAKCHLAVEDLNGDGKPDLLVVCPDNDGTIQVGINRGEDAFSFQPLALLPGTTITSVQPGDFNGDGHVDLLIEASTSGSQMAREILWGRGPLEFAGVSPLPAKLDHSTVTESDYNGDSITDLLGITADSVSTWRGQYKSTQFTEDSTITPDTDCTFGPVTSVPMLGYIYGVNAGNLVAAERCSAATAGSEWKLKVFRNDDAVQVKVKTTWLFKQAMYLARLDFRVVPLFGSTTPTGNLMISAENDKPQSVVLDNGKATVQVQLKKGVSYVAIAYPGDKANAAAGQIEKYIIHDLGQAGLPPPSAPSDSVIGDAVFHRGRQRPRIVYGVYNLMNAAQMLDVDTTSSGASCTAYGNFDSCPVLNASYSVDEYDELYGTNTITSGGNSYTITSYSGSIPVTYGSTVSVSGSVVAGSANTTTMPNYDVDPACIDSSCSGSAEVLIDGVASGAVTVTTTYNSLSCGRSCTASQTVENYSWSSSSLTDGTHTFQLRFVDGTYGTWTTIQNISFDVTGGKSSPTLAVSASPSPVTYPGSTTLTATLSGASSPTGTVTFTANGSTIGSASISGTSASISWTPSVGSYTISASYAGDTNNNAASGSTSLTVNKATPSTAVSCSNVTYPSSTTCTVTVSKVGNGTIPTGTVTFTNNGTTWGTATLNSSGQATYSGSANAGSYTMTVAYSGNSDYNTASASTTWTESKETPTMTTSCSPDPVGYGGAYQCSASVNDGATGTVTFGSPLGGGASETLVSGTATGPVGTVTSPPATYTATYTYNGDTNHNSTSATASLTVVKATPTVTTTSSLNPSTYGASVTFTATLTGSGATPTGTVTFYSNGTLLGSATLTSSGTATFMSSTLPAGSDSITSSYSGDSNYNTTSSTAMAQTVNGPTPTIAQTPVSSLNPSEYGQKVSFSSMLNTGGLSPSGAASYTADGNTLGTATLTPVTTTNLLSDSEDLTAAPWGPYCANVTSNWSNVTVDSSAVAAPDGTQTATAIVTPATETCGAGAGWGVIESNPAGMQIGQPYSASIWLRGAAGGEQVKVGFNDCDSQTFTLSTSWHRYTYSTSSYPSSCSIGDRGLEVVVTTGSATVYLWGAQLENAATVGPYIPTLGQSASGSGAIVSYSTPTLGVGTHTITAVYAGDSKTAASTSPAITQTVSTGTATASIASSASTSTYGESVTFTCSVTAYGSPVVDGTPVAFTVDGSNVSNTTTTGGNATWSSSTLAIGSHTVVCQTGGTGYTPTSVSMTQTVSIGQPTVTVVSSANPSTYGSTVTLTATVAGNGTTPTGTVTFDLNGSPFGSASTVTLNSSGVATLVASAANGDFLPTGSDSITAVYSGDANYNGAASPALTQTVNPGSYPLVITSSANPGQATIPITLEATLATPSGPFAPPTGTVTFEDGGTPIGSASFAGGEDVLLTTSSLALGSHTITAVWGGDTNYTAVTSAPFTETIEKATAISSINVAPSAATTYGQQLTFTDVLSTFGTVPTGTVTFEDGGTPIGSGSISTLTSTNLLIQSNSLTGADRVTSCDRCTGWYVESPAARGGGDPSISSLTTDGPGGALPSTGGAVVSFPDTSSGGPLGTLYSGVSQIVSTTALAGKSGTFSVWLQSSSPESIVLYLEDTASSTTVGTTTCNVTTTWTRCSVSGTFPASSTGAEVSIRSWGETAETISVWGTQLEQASQPGVYVQTTTASATGAGGLATFSISTLAPGTHTITAVYSGNTDYTSSTSPATSVTVNKALAAISAVSTPNPSAHNQNVTFTVTVAPPSGVATVPTGTVTILNGSTTIGTGTLNSSGVATISTTALPTGSDQLTVTYNGDSNFY